MLSEGQHAEAIDAFRAFIRLKPDDAEAHCNLGLALQSEGHYEEALASLRRGHELGSNRPGWRPLSASWVSECERLVRLEARLPAILKGDTQPQNNADRLGLGRVCHDKRLYAAATRLRGDALADDPKLGDDRKAGNRTNAARSAVLAGSGQGEDDPKPDDAARALLRTKARRWLAEELAAWAKLADSGAPADRSIVTKTLTRWKSDTDFAAIRDADSLAKLPEDERQAWQALWANVDALLEKAEEK